MTIRTKLIATIAGGAVLAGAGAATAFAATSPSSTPPSAPAANSTTATTPAPNGSAASGATKARRHLLERSEHTTVEVKRQGKWITIVVDRGRITAVSPTSITVTHPDGTTATLEITSTTKVRGDVTTASGLAMGQNARVISVGGNAVAIGQHQPRSAAGAPGGTSGTTSAG